MNDKKIVPSRQTTNNEAKNFNSVKVMALGGLGEVGKNCYVIEYLDGLYVIDFGVMFPDKNQLGVDYIIPNYDYLKKNEDRIKGLFITHGHEDHIGGIPFLLKKVKIPQIYAPLTAKLMIDKKLKEHKLKVKIQIIDANSVMNFDKVSIHAFRVTHSIPDALGFFIETPDGNLVTTGDFKIDFSPPGQEIADFHKMVELSKRGIMCMLSDSTNAMTPGISLSESVVGKNLRTLIKEANGRIFFTTFASNINRVQQIIQGAVEDGRKVCVIGRSLVNAIDIGAKTKYIKIKKRDLIEQKQIKDYKPEEVCIITTGSQGESLAALSRIAGGLNVHIELSHEDTVVFASNPIPGNNYQIGKVIDSLYRTGCKIVKNEDEFKTHASGHASSEEQKLLLGLWKPRNFAPVHGTHNMLIAHKKSAMLMGMKEENTFILRNGQILEFKNGVGEILKEQVPGHSVFVSGNNINISLKESTMEQLASEGILVFVSYYQKKSKKLISYPQITTRGFIVINESIGMLKNLQSEFVKVYNLNKKMKMDELIVTVNEHLMEYIRKETGKVPFITTQLIKYNPQDPPLTQEQRNLIKAREHAKKQRKKALADNAARKAEQTMQAAQTQKAKKENQK